MYKVLLMIPLIGTFLFSTAQVADSVTIGSGYPNRGYYSFANGELAQELNNNWDIAFLTYPGMNASIRINGRFGVNLFQYTAGDTSDWATLDTAGLGTLNGFSRNYDPDTTWGYSAFEANASGHPDYGWGTYNSVTHVVTGDRIFVIKTVAGNWKKLWIERLNTNGTFDIRIANLDNSNDQVVNVSKAGLTSKLLLFYNLDNTTVYDVDHDRADYDLLFMAYETELTPGVWYPVTGIVGSPDVLIAEARGIHEDDADYTAVTFSSKINEIGADWKSFQGGWVLEDSLSYFVRNANGDVWQIWFTGFASTGKFVFNTRQLAFASVQNNGQSIMEYQVYPNPTTDILNVVYTNPGNIQEGRFSIISLDGRTQYTQALNPTEGFHAAQVNVAQMGLAAGMYILEFRVGNYSSSEKFIVK